MNGGTDIFERVDLALSAAGLRAYKDWVASSLVQALRDLGSPDAHAERDSDGDIVVHATVNGKNRSVVVSASRDDFRAPLESVSLTTG